MADPVLTGRDVMALGSVLPVVVVPDAAPPVDVVALGRALLAGGVRAVEVVLRTAGALSAVERMAAEVPGLLVGAGTLTTTQQVVSAQRAGAAFLVTPGGPAHLLGALRDSGLPTLPGAITPTEVMVLADLGWDAIKIFPTAPAGGTGLVRALAGPFPEMLFCPTGGISLNDAPSYLALDAVGCVGGSWLTPAEALIGGDFDRVTALAVQTKRLNR